VEVELESQHTTLSVSDGPVGSAPNAARRIPSQSQSRFGTSSNAILSKVSNLKRPTSFLDYNKFNTKYSTEEMETHGSKNGIHWVFVAWDWPLPS